ncbi:MAG TPA: FN3 domain-containing metallophosphoesterase family protein [Lysobacter sp.]
MRTTIILAALTCATPSLAAEDIANRPYRTFEATPAIVAGPLVLNVSETSAVVAWMTDAPSDARVRFGEQSLEREAIPDEGGLLPVGTLHRVVVDGLRPGARYRYQVTSRRVVAMKPYWPERGGTAESDIAEFTTLDPSKATTRFAVITDTHEDPARVRDLLAQIRQKDVDFVVHAGDSIDDAASERQVREGFVAPTAEGLGGRIPMLYVRGNHETRGEFSRTLMPWLYAAEGRYYYTRQHGPLQLLAIDTGEDKPDATRVYSELNNMHAYRERERRWFREALAQPTAAAFRVVLVHQPEWGWTSTGPGPWTQLANDAGVDLMIAGHDHVHSWSPAGGGKNYPTLVVGQDKFAIVDADRNLIRIELFDRDGRRLHGYSVSRRTR